MEVLEYPTGTLEYPWKYLNTHGQGWNTHLQTKIPIYKPKYPFTNQNTHVHVDMHGVILYEIIRVSLTARVSYKVSKSGMTKSGWAHQCTMLLLKWAPTFLTPVV